MMMKICNNNNNNILIILLLLLFLDSNYYCEAAIQATEAARSSDDNDDVGMDEQQQQHKGTIIGIDLGTTYSCVGVYSAGSNKIEIVENDQGNRITPSYVAFSTSSSSSDSQQRLLLVGDAAKNQATLNPTNTIFDVKRLIGREYNDKSVIADSKLLPYKIINNNGRPYIQIEIEQQESKQQSDDENDATTTTTSTISTYAPEEISAMILQKLKVTAERYLGVNVHRAVITVPAYFNDAQRKATKDAGIISGLIVERIINEPTAAAMAYGLQQQQQQTNKDKDDQDDQEQNILVFDLGGGTFDVTILTIDEGIFQVLSTNGNTHLGGSDFDQTIMSYYIKKYEKSNNPKAKGLRQNTRALQKLRKEVERVKRALSSQLTANIEIDDLMPGFDISDTLTRAKFESLNHNLFLKTLKPVTLALDDAGLSKNEIDEIILVGGSTRIPKIQELLIEYFDGKKQLNKSINPDEAVAYGATIQGSILSGEYNAGNDNENNQIMLLDVTPLSLGTSIDDGLMSVLIKRGTTIPTEKSDTYHTLKANQKSMTIDVYEGERSLVKDNHFLGEFEMTNLPPGPAGSVEVDVTFKLDVNGILEVYAETKATKDSKRITIEQTSKTNRLTQDEINRMIEDAAQHAHEDQLIVEKIDARNRLESYVYSLIGTIDEHTDIMLQQQVDGITTESKLSVLELLLEKTIDWIDNNANHIDLESDDYNDKYKEIENIANPIMKQFYESNNANKRRRQADSEEGQEL